MIDLIPFSFFFLRVFGVPSSKEIEPERKSLRVYVKDVESVDLAYEIVNSNWKHDYRPLQFNKI